MNTLSRYTTKDLDSLMKSLSQYSVGMDNVFNRMEEYGSSAVNYPPFNLIKITPEKWKLEMALAGWSREQVEVSTENNVLTIRSKDLPGGSKEDGEYIHKGLASRAFSRSFTLADDVKINYAKLTEGMLQIEMERVLPDHMKKKVYEIC